MLATADAAKTNAIRYNRFDVHYLAYDAPLICGVGRFFTWKNMDGDERRQISNDKASHSSQPGAADITYASQGEYFGYKPVCWPCPPGKYRNPENGALIDPRVPADACASCPLGQFQLRSGGDRCQLHPNPTVAFNELPTSYPPANHELLRMKVRRRHTATTKPITYDAQANNGSSLMSGDSRASVPVHTQVQNEPKQDRDVTGSYTSLHLKAAGVSQDQAMSNTTPLGKSTAPTTLVSAAKSAEGPITLHKERAFPTTRSSRTASSIAKGPSAGFARAAKYKPFEAQAGTSISRGSTTTTTTTTTSSSSSQQQEKGGTYVYAFMVASMVLTIGQVIYILLSAVSSASPTKVPSIQTTRRMKDRAKAHSKSDLQSFSGAGFSSLPSVAQRHSVWSREAMTQAVKRFLGTSRQPVDTSLPTSATIGAAAGHFEGYQTQGDDPGSLNHDRTGNATHSGINLHVEEQHQPAFY